MQETPPSGEDWGLRTLNNFFYCLSHAILSAASKLPQERAPGL